MNNKKNIWILILGCLFFGGVLGWMIRGGEEHPEGEHTHTAEDGTVYTCSMHPQIRQDEPGQCPLCGMALTPLSGKKTDSSPFVLEMTPEAIALSNIMTTKVKSGDAGSNIQLTGKIQPNEQRVKSISANFSGRIDELHVSFTGQEVRKGQKLASLYSPDLVNAQKELLETVKIKDRQPALYEAAKEKLRLWQIPAEQIAKIESSGDILTQFDIFSDASGVVTARNVAVGDFINRGTVLFDVVDLSQVWVLLDAYEGDLAGIRKGDGLTFRVSAYPGKEFEAKVAYIDPILNAETRTVAIRAEAANPGLQLKPEMFVSANIKSTAAAQSSGLMIPNSSILWTGPRAVVYVQVGSKDAPAFEMREVTLGSRSGDDYLVLSGLDEGEEIVSNGVFAVDGAAQLSGNYSMMMKPEVKSLEVPTAFTGQLSDFLDRYLTIKDALVKSDPEAVKTLVPEAKSVLAEVDMQLLDDKPHEIWMQLLGPIRTSLEKLQSTSDVEEQRKQFESLSDHMIEAVEHFGVKEKPVFKQYCPMAFRDKGAYWLSVEREILNPYFGDAMLSCGEVKDTYEPNKIVLQDSPTPSQPAHNH